MKSRILGYGEYCYKKMLEEGKRQTPLQEYL